LSGEEYNENYDYRYCDY